MHVRFIAQMMEKGYSGGRLMALSYAEALASTSTKVDFLVNNIPEMYEEFRPFSKIDLVQADFDNLSPLVNKNVVVVFIVPGGNISYHSEALRHGIECHAKIVLLNFESPNWFNLLSPNKRPLEMWTGWDLISEYADLIFSISGEGNKFAKMYYTKVPRTCIFNYSYVAINSYVADSVQESCAKEKNIISLTRLDAHKGFNTLAPLINTDLAGYTFYLFLGNGMINKKDKKRWQKKFDKANMKFVVQSAIKGYEKYTLLKSSSLLYFPSRFEGFGIPPLEAAYCKLPVACSDLPVLREFGKDAFTYGNPEDTDSMRNCVVEALQSRGRVEKEHSRISRIGKMEEAGKKLLKVLEEIL
jgi:glycosyltransferase involved in cell wall biosynthesis